MSTLYQVTTRSFGNLTESVKAVLLGFVLLAVSILMCNVDTGYTATRVVSTTVIAKTDGATQTKSSASPYFIVAVRHPDGTTQDVYTTFAEYSQTAVGSVFQVEVSNHSLGHDMPLITQLVIVAFLVSAVGALCAFVAALFLS